MPVTRRAAILYLGAIFIVATALAGCDGFYSDSLTTSSATTPTSAANLPDDPRAAIEQTARAAIAERSGVAPGTPRLIGYRGATWTTSNSGCFPLEGAAGDGQIVPGITVTFEYENVVYRYDANEAGTSGALCESTHRAVTAYSAASLFDGNTPDPGGMVILRTQQEAEAFMSSNLGVMFDAGVVDWPTEALGAIPVGLPDTSMEPSVGNARLSEDGSTVIIELTAFETSTAEPGTYPLWVFLEDIDNADSIDVEMTVTQATEPAETPPAFNFQ